MNVTLGRLLWLGAGAIGIAGFILLLQPLETRLEIALAASDTAVNALALNEAIEHRRPALEREALLGRRRLAHFTVSGDESAIVAAFLRECASVAARHRLEVGAVGTMAHPSSEMRSEPTAWRTTTLDVTLRGSYRDVLAAVRDIARGPIVSAIEIESIERELGREATAPMPLAARLRISLERLDDSPATLRGLHDHPRPT